MRTAIGQDSHRFSDEGKGCLLGGVFFDDVPSLQANSDGDVVYHALTNAISGITCVNILGGPADEMCSRGITDSAEYVRTALKDLREMGYRIENLSFSVECKRPRLFSRIDEMKENIAGLCGISPAAVGVTATSGEGLTDFGKGLGISVFCIITAEKAE